MKELSNIKVIDKQDIQRLKSYIDKKYSDLDSKQRANILSKAIHGVLDKFILGINNEDDNNIKMNILKNSIYGEQYTVYLLDVFKYYLKDIRYREEDSIEALIIWISKHTKYQVNKESIIDYLYDENYINIEEKNRISKTYFEQRDKLENNQSQPEKTLVESKEIITVGQANKKSNHFNLTGVDFNKYIINIRDLNIRSWSKRKFTYITCILGLLAIFGSMYIKTLIEHRGKIIEETILGKPGEEQLIEAEVVKVGQAITGKEINPNIPGFIKYKEVNKESLRKFLNERNSLLAEEPYFSTIINAAKGFDINPILLFAITGQEQGFVPKNTPDGNNIANNPFNVFHSWKDYNTDIEDSSDIAARTVFNICSKMPKGENVFQWINKTYAEDENWWKGVESIFYQINNLKL